MAECSGCCEECFNKLCMRKIPIFSSLGHDDLVKIASMIQHREYRKGDSLFTVGGTPDSLFIINSGSVKAFKYTPDGHEQILYVFGEGDFFGERNLLSSTAAAYTVETLTPLKVCTLSKDNFQQLLLSYPGIAVKIIQGLGARMERLENSLQSMGVRSVDNRIGTLILDFAEKYGTNVPEGTLIRLPLSREGIANYLGVARETVSRKFSQLESDGVIRLLSGKSILLLDRFALETMSGIG